MCVCGGGGGGGGMSTEPEICFFLSDSLAAYH